jgi:hypothetical protein
MEKSLEKIGKFQVKQIGDPADRVLRFLGTDETEDRDHDIIKADGWKFENYLKNPVFLPFHNSWTVPAAKCVGITRGSGMAGVSFDIKFASIEDLCTNPDTPSQEALLADTLYNAYMNGFMSAVSIGFIVLESEENDSGENKDLPSWQRGRIFTSQEMIELSAVAIPANPNALIQARSFKGWKAGQFDILKTILSPAKKIKGAIAYKKFPLADKDSAWDGATVVKEADVDDLKVVCAWFDSDNAEDKGAYKLPHHLGSADGHKTVWAGVKAAMGALLGARGGVGIPEGDKEKVHAHLSKHYKEFDEEAPELKSYSATELKAMFPAEELDMKADEVTKAITDAVAPLLKRIQAFELSQKAGAKHSAVTLEKMQTAMDHIQRGYATLKDLMDGDGEEPGGQNPSETDPGIDNESGQEGNAADKSFGIDLSKINLDAMLSA